MYREAERARRELPGYLSARASREIGREVTLGGVSLWPPFTVHSVRVLPAPGETAPPLEAPRARVSVSWWDLLLRRRLRVTGIDFYQARIAGRADAGRRPEGTPEITGGILALARAGLRRAALHSSAAEIVLRLPTGDRETLRIEGIEASAGLAPGSFRFRARAGLWRIAGLEARDLELAGKGVPGSITLTRSRVRFQGGTVSARGTLGTEAGDVALTLQARELPVDPLWPRLGIPEEWNARGRLTGLVELSAVSGELRRARGTLTVAPGSVARSDAVFPWHGATAELDWRPESVVLRGIDIQGEGIRLRGEARVGGPAARPFPRRPFRASGMVEAARTEAVAGLARLLAFRAPVAESWGVRDARMSFRASGVVGALEQARATGRFHAHGITLAVRRRSPPLGIGSAQGEVERTAERLVVRNLVLLSEGLTARGRLTVAPGPGGPRRAERFAVEGRVDLTGLRTLRAQLPDLPLWRWLSPALPASRGEVLFSAAGPVGDPARAAGSGRFRFRSFAASLPTGRGEERWAVPIRELTGALRLANDRLAISRVRLASDLFRGAAELSVANVTGAATIGGTARLVSERWRELPPLRGRVPEGIAGGILSLEAEIPPGVGLRQAGFSRTEGTAALRGATYRPGTGGRARELPVRSARARWRAADTGIALPSFELITPLLTTRGSGFVRSPAPGAPEGRFQARGTLTAGDAGDLLRWWSREPLLEGGRLTARYTVEGSARELDRAAVSARVRLEEALPLLPKGALPFAPEEARIRSLTGLFRLEGGVAHFRDAVWRAPAFVARGTGWSDGRTVEGRLHLTTDRWARIAPELARTLPVSGGRLSVDARLRGPVSRPGDLPVAGTLRLAGARLASDRNASVPLRGGRVDVTARARGTLRDLAQADAAGSFRLRDVPLPSLRPGAQAARILLAQGRFDRAGTRVRLSGLEARLPGVRLAGSGELRGVGTGAASHAFQLSAGGESLAALLPVLVPLPGRASGGAFTGSLSVSGDASSPVERMEGAAEVRGGEWTAPGQVIPIRVRRASVRFARSGPAASIRHARLRVEGGQASLTGSFTGLGTAAPRHDLRLVWELKDASGWATRFLPVPGWFAGGTFTGRARLTGTPQAPVERAAGRFDVRDAGFMPPAPFLGGPDRPIRVERARGHFSRAAGKTVLSRLDLSTEVGTATGRVTAVDGGAATVRAQVDVSRLQALIDLWPPFRERIRGGRAGMQISLRGPLRRPRDLTGAVEIRAGGGVLTVADVGEAYAAHPFDEFRVRMRLEGGGRVLLREVAMRGPKANLDGSAVVDGSGRIEGRGKAWFTERFTKSLVKPPFLRPLAKLVGLRRLKSDFRIEGTVREARLKMGITRSLLWPLVIRSRVPRPLRQIATGERPLWSAPGASEEPRRAQRARVSSR